MSARFARVVFDPLIADIERPFDYAIPRHWVGRLQPGQRVVVPLGGRRVEGLVIGLTDQPEVDPARVRPLAGIVDDKPLLGLELMDLGHWLAGRYLCSLGEAFRVLLPPGVRRVPQRYIMLQPAAREALAAGGATAAASEAQRLLLQVLAAWSAGKAAEWREALARFCELSLPDVASEKTRRNLRDSARAKAFQTAVDALQRQGWLAVDTRYVEQAKPLEEGVLELLAPAAEVAAAAVQLQARAPRQAALLQVLAEAGEPLPAAEALRRAQAGHASIKPLEQRGLLRRVSRQVRRRPSGGLSDDGAVPLGQPLTLTPAQQAALERIQQAQAAAMQGGPQTVLLLGVTGSGKTEVYLQAIGAAVAAGRQALVLVPEIALTPQMIGRFRSRFGERVAVLHSALGAGERFDEWRRIASGEVAIAVGARSALFAPFSRLGLIVIDEEHENTYKQEENPRYQAREVAEFLARRHGAALVLGSATPSLETYQRALRGEIACVELPERVAGRPLPPAEVIDLRAELTAGHRGVLSRRLCERLMETVASGDQAILFLNRRGYSTFVLCRSCGYTVKCPDCDVSLTFHQGETLLRCHYCGHQEQLPSLCPACDSRYIRFFGSGTEKVVEELAELLPGARVGRMDVDTTRRKGSHEEILGRFGRREIDILVGTQMVAKGLDFPGVTLVGVIAADVALNFPDFRAAERTFQLLTQVAGRAGRGERPGSVLVQTYNPNHYAVQAACRHDYRGFAAQELELRRALRYPPFGFLVKLLVSGSDGGEVAQAAHTAAGWLRTAWEPAAVLGPAPAPLARLRGQFRWQTLARGDQLAPLIEAARGVQQRWHEHYGRDATVRLSVDVNPQHML